MASLKLHITNGDCTTNLLKKLNFSGTIVTWREMLCEGKTIMDVGSESFWKTRYDFFSQAYKTPKQTFIDLTVKEYRKLCNQKEQDEIVLWFEYDLFCQINMLAVISWLKRYRKNRQISLVCSGSLTTREGLFGLAELSDEELQNHYDNRKTLSQDDIEFADYMWQLYCSDSPLRLETALQLNKNSAFTYLHEAIIAHLQRFPSIKNGLNKLENQILQLATQENFTSEHQFVGGILRNQGNYGFGDSQYFNKLTQLKGLFDKFNPVTLSEKGKAVLENQLNYYAQIRSDFSYLGGSKKYSYLCLTDTNKLLKITS